LHRELLAGDDAHAIAHAVSAALAAIVELTCARRISSVSVTLEELAAHARLDRFQLCRAFRDDVGCRRMRTSGIAALAQALLARRVAQAEVAASVGLYDQSPLHRHFKPSSA
jgi:AraC-like DNA-binding protein